MVVKDMENLEKPREKMLVYGSESLSDAELVAILLRTGDVNKSVLSLAEEVVTYDKRGLGFLQNCIPEELFNIKGIGKAKACQLVAATELGKRLARREADKRISLKDPASVAAHFMQNMRYYKKECFKVLMFDSKMQIIAEETVAVGNVNTTVIEPREVFNKAVKNSTVSMILVHNHPSGKPAPSRDDILLTKRLVEAGELLGIKIIDHIIIGDGTYVSLREENPQNF